MDDERFMLAAALLASDARDQLALLGEADFTTKAHQTIAAVIRDMHRRGGAVDVQTVAAELESQGNLGRIGGSAALFTMTMELPTATNGAFLAHRLRQKTRLRMMQELTRDTAAALAKEQAVENLDELIRWQQTRQARIPGLLEGDNIADDSVRALLAKEFPPDVWLIPERMLRGDRLVLTGGEGAGKAWLMRQIAACAAAGVDPFTMRPFDDEGYRVLVLDAENGGPEMQESFARLESVLPDNGWQDRMFAFDREAGLDLTRADLGWLHQKAAAISPDLIVVGPVYKIMFGRDPRDEQDTLALLTALDDVRVRHRAGMIIEHHAPHGNGLQERSMRPSGSSYWMRWATVGLGLKAHDMRKEGFEEAWGMPEWKDRPEFLDVMRWRFMRGHKRWPDALVKGPVTGLPWLDYDWGGTPAPQLLRGGQRPT